MAQLLEAADKTAKGCHIFLVVLGLCGAFLAAMGSYSCSFLEVKNGSIDGLDFSGTAGLMRFANETSSCQRYEASTIDGDINFQIASFSAWGAPIAAMIGGILGLVQALVTPGCGIFIMLSYGCAFTFLCLSFFLRQTSVCGDCSISTGAYYMLAAMCLVFFPGSCIMCIPAPMGKMQKGMVNKFEDDMAGDVEGETAEEKKKRKNKNERKMIRMALGDPTAMI